MIDRRKSNPTSSIMVQVKTTTQLVIVVALIFLGLGTALATPSIRTSPSFVEIGTCASFDLVENFQPEKYVGQWYSVWNVPSQYIPARSYIVNNVTLKGHKLKVVTTGLSAEGISAKSEGLLNIVTLKNKKKKPYMELQAPYVPPVKYYIIDTDYTSYSCVYSCYSFLGVKAELFWIYSRTPQIPPEGQQNCLRLFKSQSLATNKLIKVRQEGDNHPIVEEDQLDVDEGESGSGSQGNLEDTDSVVDARLAAGYSDDEDIHEGSGEVPLETVEFTGIEYERLRYNLEGDSKLEGKETVSIWEDDIVLLEEGPGRMTVVVLEDKVKVVEEEPQNPIVKRTDEGREGGPPKKNIEDQRKDIRRKEMEQDLFAYGSSSFVSSTSVPVVLAVSLILHILD